SADRACSARPSWTKPTAALTSTTAAITPASTWRPSSAASTAAATRNRISGSLNWRSRRCQPGVRGGGGSALGPCACSRRAASADARPSRPLASRARACAASTACQGSGGDAPADGAATGASGSATALAWPGPAGVGRHHRGDSLLQVGQQRVPGAGHARHGAGIDAGHGPGLGQVALPLLQGLRQALDEGLLGFERGLRRGVALARLLASLAPEGFHRQRGQPLPVAGLQQPGRLGLELRGAFAGSARALLQPLPAALLQQLA